MKSILGTIALACAGSSCVNYGKLNERNKARLVERAPFELDCQELEYKELERYGHTVTSYGVHGCETRAVYVLGAHSWALNSVDGGLAAIKKKRSIVGVTRESLEAQDAQASPDEETKRGVQGSAAGSDNRK